MEMRNIRGKLVNAMIEVITDGAPPNYILASDVEEPTQGEVEKFFANPCDHNNQYRNLVYDEPTFLYDNRYCVVCGKFLGGI